LATLKSYLKIDTNDDDAILTFLIRAATEFIESYTKRVLITTEFLTYRDCFYADGCCGILLKRSPFDTLTLFTYLNTNNVETVVPIDTYFTTDDIDYSKILELPDKTFPTDVLKRVQVIRIQFTAGYGVDESYVPVDLQVAMMQIIADLYSNRGDCGVSDVSSCGCQKVLSGASKAILDKYRILEL
jgi:uncharacterized phiE125 gp8 family phage protein